MTARKELVWKKVSPGKAGGFRNWAAQSGRGEMLTRPRFCWPLKAALAPHVHLVEPGVSSTSCLWMYSLITAWSRSTVETKYPRAPEVLPYEVALPLAIDPRQVDSALALDVLNYLRHRILGWIEIIM